MHFDGYSDSMSSRRGVFVVIVGVVVVVVADKIDRELQVPGGTGTNRGRGLCSSKWQKSAWLIQRGGWLVVVFVVVVVVVKADRSVASFQTHGAGTRLVLLFLFCVVAHR